MLHANELRIGNNFECMGMIQTVSEIHDNTDHGRIIQAGYEFLILCKENRNQYKPIEISGIPLTEEWLRKFGFKYQDRDVSHGKGKIERFFIYDWFAEGDNWGLEINLHPITKDSTGFYWLNWDIGGGRNFVHLPHSCKLEFAHQLQNFIHDLTGTELTIK